MTDPKDPPLDPLGPERLRWTCPPEVVDFPSSADAPPLEGILGQPRALRAIETAVGIDDDGYGLFVHGIPGTGRHSIARRTLEAAAAKRPPAADWCYVENFADRRRPRALSLPAGLGRHLHRGMERMIAELEEHLPGVFEGEDYLVRRQALQEGLEERTEKAWEEVAEEAGERGLSVKRSPVGLVFTPEKEGKPLTREEAEDLPQEEQERLAKEVDALRERVGSIFRQQLRWRRELRNEVEALEKELVRQAVQLMLEDSRRELADHREVLRHLDLVEDDAADRGPLLARAAVGEAGGDEPTPMGLGEEERSTPLGRLLARYRVNLLVDHGDDEGAPVIYEDHPTLANLVGRIDHRSRLGTLVTDFTMIRAGALHRANGGTLILDADRLLMEPMARQALKRTLRSGTIQIESLGAALGFLSTESLEPEPVPLRLQVVLIGDPFLFWAISHGDPELRRHFKIAADVSDHLDLDRENLGRYARFLCGILRDQGLRPFDRGALARVVEESVRETGDRRRLSLVVEPLLDLLREADLEARSRGGDGVTAADVEGAIAARRHRADRLAQQILDSMERGIRLIATDGEAVGQVNGLVVSRLPDLDFGSPTRITARVRLGQGGVVDIEREVELGGPIHSKGVLILAGFLGGRYARDVPLALSASLVFEQSYGGIEGDSASLGELCALLSALGDVPIRQSLAVTGSVNQRGEVQAIGGVNEKIEGFFELCRRRGLDGSHGVLVPAANVEHLVLRREVVDAVADGRFRVWAVRTVDEALALLTGRPAGELGEDGEWTEDSVNAEVEDRLRELAALRSAWQRSPDGSAPGETAPPSETPV